MKMVLWLLFALLAFVWTGAIALGVQLVDWVLAGVASGQVAGAVVSAGERGPPGWLVAWLDPAAVQALTEGMRASLRWLGGVLPMADGLVGWTAFALWAIWAVGLIMLLIVTGALHWGLGRLSRPAVPAG
jgi:hypothetical protein